MSFEDVRSAILDGVIPFWSFLLLTSIGATVVYVVFRLQTAKKFQPHVLEVPQTPGLPAQSLLSNFDDHMNSAHRARFSYKPAGDDEAEATRSFLQRGYKTWAFGSRLRRCWMLIPIFSQLQLAHLTFEQYLGLGWDATASRFIFVFFLSHIVLFLMLNSTTSLEVFFLQHCTLADAEFVRIEDDDDEHSDSWLQQLQKKVSKVVLVPVKQDDREGDRFYEYTCVRYLWDTSSQAFRSTGTLEITGEGAHTTLRNGGLSNAESVAGLRTNGFNQIRVEVPNVISSLFIEYADPVYVFQLLCIWSYVYYSSWNIAAIWVVLVFGSGAWKSVFIVRENQRKIQEMASQGSDRAQTVFRNGEWCHVAATELVLGDIVQVFEGPVPADIALISGSAVVNESMLTGEPMPLQKVPLETHMKFPFDIKKQGKKHALFCGTEVLQSVAVESETPDCEYSLGMVVAVGGRTTKGQLIRMVLFPSTVKFRYSEQLPIVYLTMTLYAIMCLLCTIWLQGAGIVVAFFTGMSFFTQSLNPMMAVSFTMGQTASSERLQDASVACLNLGRIPIAGKIGTMVFDKTGTITHGGMDLFGVRPVSEGAVFACEVAAHELNDALNDSKILLYALAGCQSVTTMRDGSLVGNGVEVATVTSLGWKLSAPGEPRSIRSNKGDQLLSLRQLEFDHHRMTSGAVVRDASSGRIFVFIKGAYDKVEQLVQRASVPGDFAKVCEDYALACFYVLAISWKELPSGSNVSEIAAMPRDSLENGLELCGLVLFRNEMKADSKDAIAEIKAGGITCVICTGDNTTTGVSIARTCGIIDVGARVLLAEMNSVHAVEWRDPDCKHAPLQDWTEAHGRVELAISQPAFRYFVRENPEIFEKILPRVKVYGRMKPDDKIKVITLWQNLGGEGVVTGMTGDGGNDCGALRAAHAGIALSEAEASMVSPFSSSKGAKEKGFISLFAVLDMIREGRACLATNVATYMFFLVYNLCITSTKLLLIVWIDGMYAEWQFVLCDVVLGIAMVSSMVKCRPADKLAPVPPTASLLGAKTLLTLLTTVVIIWASLGLLILSLLWGPTAWFYEYSTSALSEIPSQDWPKKGDNHITAMFFLHMIASLFTVGFMYSNGHVHRADVTLNARLCVMYVLGAVFVGVLIWSPPSSLTCMFRVNCDTATSRNMDIPFISTPKFGIKLSCGNLGGCFLGPQMVSCSGPDCRCWVVPPLDAGIQMTKNLTCAPKVPFKTHAEKKQFCKKKPYESGRTEYDGTRFCFSIDKESQQCGPNPPVDLGQSVKGCEGPNNCFSSAFSFTLTLIFIANALALHGVYRFAVTGTKLDDKGIIVPRYDVFRDSVPLTSYQLRPGTATEIEMRCHPTGDP